MSRYLAMTDAEFKAYWDAREQQIARVHRRTLLYGALLVLSAVIVLYFLAAAVDAPEWAFALLSGVAGIAAARLGRWLARCREADLT